MSKVLLISTHFDDNLEIATMPWAVGNAALAEDKEVTIFLQGLASLCRALLFSGEGKMRLIRIFR